MTAVDRAEWPANGPRGRAMRVTPAFRSSFRVDWDRRHDLRCGPGRGHADGVAAGVAAVSDVDQLVADPQAEPGLVGLLVGVAGGQQADEGVGRSVTGVGDGTTDPTPYTIVTAAAVSATDSNYDGLNAADVDCVHTTPPAPDP